MSHNGIVSVDDDSFEAEVLKSEVPVFVDFSATWCAPCKRQMPIMEKFATDNLEKIKVCSIDIEDSPTITSRYGIKSVPTILVFIKGQKIESKVGLTSSADLSKILEKI